ncbi:MAG: hypothetical protein MSH23_02610, partial [Campylobacter lanienae]|nr:hypothetical protein [Campylobacter lanienae]
TRNLLNEFKEAVKEIEKQVVKTDNQPNLANQANSGNIDSLTKQISYLQNAIKNSTKDAPTPSTAIKQEVDSLSQATPNLTQNSIKGDGFVMSDNGVEPKSDLNVKISIDEWVKELAGINPNKQIIADLEHLYEKHKELFSKPSEVFKLIKAVKDNPTFFYTNNQPNIALIGSILENGKLGKIGIQKDFNSDNLQVRHATYSSNAKKENERLLKRNSYPVGSPTPTQLTFGKTAEPTANGAKALLGKKEKAVSGDALPPHLDADNTSLTGRYSVGGKPHLTAVDENIIPQNAKNEVKEQTKSTQINEQTAKVKSEPKATTAKERAAQTTATQKQAIKPQEPTDDRKYFKNFDSEEYKKISNPYLSRNIKNGDIKNLIDNGFDDYNQKVQKEILDFIKLDKDLYEYYQYQEKYREVDYAAETFRSRHYDISSLSTRANIWAQDFSDKYLMAKYELTKDELAKKRAKWNDSLVKNVISIPPIKEFGTNYAEFYHDGANAIKKLLTERQGQVAGAFHKDWRDITISWGEVKMANGDIKGYGLSKIEAKHIDDFAIFEGSTPQEKMANGINKIIEKGKIVSDNGIDTIWYKKGDSYFLVGLSKGFKGVGDDSWVVTSYKKTNISENKKAEINEVLNGSGNSKTLSAYAEIKSSKTPELTTAENSTTSNIKSQDPTADAPSELYKAHRKAQKAKEAPKPQEPQAKSEPMATQITKTKATTKAEPTQETFDILKIDKNISDEQVETLLKEIEDKNLKVNLPLRDEEALGKAFQKDELGYGRKRLLNLALNEQFLKRHKGFIERAEKTQSKAEFQKFLKENKAEVVEYIKDMVTNTLRYIDSYGEGYHFTNTSSLRRANEMILNLQNGKNFYFYNHAPNKITNPAPKSDYADKLVDGNEAIQGTYKISDEIKQDLIKSLKEFVGSRQNLAENIANIQSRWWYKIKEQERLAPSILEGGKKANNGYDENLKKALEHEVYLFNQFERKIVKNPQKTSSDLELANNYYRFSKGDTYTKKALDEINQTRQILEQELNIRPIREFGTNYAEFYHDGENAIKKLLTERQGQVAGAFEREELGDIDLVWGNDKIGLNKIILKHSDDFKSFGGIENGLNEIITNGKIINENGVDTIWYKKGNDYYVVGLSKGFNGTRNNNWVITSYKKSTGYIPNEVKGDTANLSAYSGKFKGELTSPHPPLTNTETIPNQNINQAETAKAQKARQYAKWLSQADKMIPPQAPDELYKAYDKAKKDLKPKK